MLHTAPLIIIDGTPAAAEEIHLDPITQLKSGLSERYSIEREVGQGGMATVYLARDVKHNRKVALKVLRPELGAILGTERFLAEISVTANLQHPHLLPLFDSGEVDGLLYYVMPFVEGESLRQRLERERQLPVEESIRIATAVASALDYAHQRGVIHRDLKPENILLHAGQPLVADFGIALAVSNAGGARITQTGISLGTPQYMSPEQATADQIIDGRTDIYSLAAVLYEMLAGEPPHTGRTAQAIMAKLLTEVPRRVRTTRHSIPLAVDDAIARALEKLPPDRFDNARQFADALHGQINAQSTRSPATVRSRVPQWAILGVVLIGGSLLGASVLNWSKGSSSGLEEPVLRATINLPAEAPLVLASPAPSIGFHSPVIALSPDGAWLTYVAGTTNGSLLYLRDMASGEVRALPGTEGAINAFFSPDGNWVGFLTSTHVKKIARAGGTVTSLSEAKTPVLGWWARNGFIYFTENELTILTRVPQDGGSAARVVLADQVTPAIRYFLDILPGGKSALATLAGTSMSGEFGSVVIVDLEKRSARRLIPSAYAARFVSPDLILFARAGSLMAVRFDAGRGETIGEPTPISTGTTMESIMRVAHFASSDNGLLALVPGGDLSVGKLAWVDRAGRVEILPVDEKLYGKVDLSPDGGRIAVQVADVNDYIWIWDLKRGEGRRVANNGGERNPSWSPDGRRLAGATGVQPVRILVHNVEPDGTVGEGVAVGDGIYVSSWSPDGNVVAAMVSQSPFRTGFIGLGKTVQEPAFEGGLSAFSPDGRWLAYVSTQTGENEVFIREYPGGRNAGQVSVGGCVEPNWLPNGDLYCRNGQRWFVTRVTTNPHPRWYPPRKAFDTDFIDTPGLSYDIAPDGRLLVVKRTRPITQSRIEIVSNWTSLLPVRN